MVQAVLVVLAFSLLAIQLMMQGQAKAGSVLLCAVLLIGGFELVRIRRKVGLAGSWDIVIDEHGFRWSSPHPSLGLAFDLPLNTIAALLVTHHPLSELGNDRTYELVLTDGARQALWGWEGVPMDDVVHCLESHGVRVMQQRS